MGTGDKHGTGTGREGRTLCISIPDAVSSSAPRLPLLTTTMARRCPAWDSLNWWLARSQEGPLGGTNLGTAQGEGQAQRGAAGSRTRASPQSHQPGAVGPLPPTGRITKTSPFGRALLSPRPLHFGHSPRPAHAAPRGSHLAGAQCPQRVPAAVVGTRGHGGRVGWGRTTGLRGSCRGCGGSCGGQKLPPGRDTTPGKGPAPAVPPWRTGRGAHGERGASPGGARGTPGMGGSSEPGGSRPPPAAPAVVRPAPPAVGGVVRLGGGALGPEPLGGGRAGPCRAGLRRGHERGGRAGRLLEM